MGTFTMRTRYLQHYQQCRAHWQGQGKKISFLPFVKFPPFLKEILYTHTDTDIHETLPHLSSQELEGPKAIPIYKQTKTGDLLVMEWAFKVRPTYC